MALPWSDNYMSRLGTKALNLLHSMRQRTSVVKEPNIVGNLHLLDHSIIHKLSLGVFTVLVDIVKPFHLIVIFLETLRKGSLTVSGDSGKWVIWKSLSS